MTKEQYSGCVCGLAIGDALGFPNEFNDRKTNLLRRNNKELTDLEPTLNFARGKTKRIGKKLVYEPVIEFPAGTYSDDTQMSLALARALLRNNFKKYDLNNIMKNVQEEFIDWLNDKQTDRAPGKACIAGCRKMAKGIFWRQSGDYAAKGCGAAMRSAPIGLMFYDDLEKLVEISDAASKCTHAHPTAISAGIGTAYLTALALQRKNPEKWIDEILQKEFFNLEFKNKIAEIKTIKAKTDIFKEIEQIGQGWKGDEAVAIALYCFLRNPKNYAKSVLTAANIDGDTDSVSCITGAISGAYNGINKIPEKWIQNIENSENLKEIGGKLFEKKQSIY